MQTSRSFPKKYFIFVGTMSAVLLIFILINAFICNQVESMTLPEQTGIFLKRRMETALNSLPALTEKDEKLAFFWGASEIESGLNTEIVDKIFLEQGLPYKAVNVGMRSVHPVVYEVFSERVRDYFKASGKKIAISYVKVPLNKLTKRYMQRIRFDATYDQLAVLLPSKNIPLWKSNFFLYLRARFHHLVLNDATTDVIRILAQRAILHYFVPKAESDIEKFYSIWTDSDFMEKSAWNLERKGSFLWNLPDSKTNFERRIQQKKDFAVREASYDQFEFCCAMGNPVYDESMVKVFMQQIANLKEISEKVVLYTIPEEPSYSHRKGATYDRNKERLMLKLSLETGSEVDDEPMFLADDDYIDFLHLSESGQQKFYQALISRQK